MLIELNLPTPHKQQQFLLDNRKRLNVLKCGRRWGKTELCQELILETFEKSQFAGYFSPTYKDLFEVWHTTLNNFKPIIKSKNETVKQVEFINGSKVDFWSMEDPDSGRGRKYHRAIMDECEKALKFQQAWEQAIAPTLTDFGGDAYFLSTPKFGETYFKSLAKKSLQEPDLWATFIYSTYDNPHIPPEEIEMMRQILPPHVFECEYLALDVDGKTPAPFAYQFDYDHHVNPLAMELPEKQLYISMDFNLNPYAVTFWMVWQNQDGFFIDGIDEVEITQGSIPAMIDLIKQRYPDKLYTAILTGDSMGNQQNMARRDNASHYTEIARGLNLHTNQIKVPPNPTHKNSRAEVNYLFWASKKPGSKLHIRLHPNRMKQTIQDLKLVQCDAFDSILKRNRNDLSQRADYLDTLRSLFHLVNIQFRLDKVY